MAELTVPRIDFSPLGDYGNIYKQAQADQLRQQTLQNLGQGGTADATALLKSGDMSLAQLGINMQNRAEDRAHQAARDQVSDQHWATTDKRAAAAEGRAAYEFEHTPDQYVPNPNAGQPGQPALVDQYAAARTAATASTIPDNYELNPDYGKVEGAARLRPVSGGPADPTTVSNLASAKAGATNANDVPQSTVDFLADRTRLGDQRHLVGLTKVPGLIGRVQTAAQQREEAGIPIGDQARAVVGNQITLHARNAAEGKLGTIATNNEFYGNNALGAIDIAEKASADVPRTNYPKINEALNAYRTNSGDPKTVALGGAINTLINDYAKFAGGGTPTDALRGEAYTMLNAAHSHQQFQAVANMMRTEINRGKQSPGMVRQGFDDVYRPGGTGAAQPPQGTGAQVQSPPPGGVVDYKTYFSGGH